MVELPKIDLHMHTTVSDGSDDPAELVLRIRETGLDMFSVTDHDAIKGCRETAAALGPDDPFFIPGVEFACRDGEGKYHILGYAYDIDSPAINSVVSKGHSIRLEKLAARLDFLKEYFGIVFPDKEIKKLHGLSNPGKPHLGNLMVKYGYAASREEAIRDFINKKHFPTQYLSPKEAIDAILASGGVPVLAHPSYGSGDDLFVGEEMEQRLKRLLDLGLQGVEACYSGFTAKLRAELLGYSEKYGLYVTAGSDYHGANKLVELGDTCMSDLTELPEGMKRFLSRVGFEPENQSKDDRPTAD